MNSVILVGRLARDPELRYTAGSQTPMATFTLAVDRPYARREEDAVTADFLRIVVYGKQAENVSAYLSKGRQAAVQGRIQTGSYTRQDGQKVYTTDIIAERVEFIGGRSDNANSGNYAGSQSGYQNPGSPQGPGGGSDNSIPDGFHAFDDEDDDNIPF